MTNPGQILMGDGDAIKASYEQMNNQPVDWDLSNKEIPADPPAGLRSCQSTGRQAMKLDRVHQISEIIASVAIVASLIFVGVQVRTRMRCETRLSRRTRKAGRIST